MRSGEVAKLLGVDSSTIRRYTLEYGRFLSKKAGAVRTYTADDYAVIATIRTLYQDGYSGREIVAKLDDGFRVDTKDMSVVGLLDSRVIPVTVAEQMVDASGIRSELENLRAERDRLVEAMHSKDEKIEKLQAEVIRLNRELGKLEGRLSSVDPDYGNKS